MKSVLRRCSIITGGTWQWQESEPRFTTPVSHNLGVFLSLSSCAAASKAQLRLKDQEEELSPLWPWALFANPSCFERRRCADVDTVHDSSSCSLKHCTHRETAWAFFSGFYQYWLLCVLYVGHVFSVKVRYSVTFNLLLSVHTYHTVCSITSFPVWQKISDFHKHLQPSLCRGNISWNSCNAHEWSLWQEHWLLLLPAGHVVFLHTRSIIHIPLANI